MGFVPFVGQRLKNKTNISGLQNAHQKIKPMYGTGGYFKGSDVMKPFIFKGCNLTVIP